MATQLKNCTFNDYVVKKASSRYTFDEPVTIDNTSSGAGTIICGNVDFYKGCGTEVNFHNVAVEFQCGNICIPAQGTGNVMFNTDISFCGCGYYYGPEAFYNSVSFCGQVGFLCGEAYMYSSGGSNYFNMHRVNMTIGSGSFELDRNTPARLLGTLTIGSGSSTYTLSGFSTVNGMIVPVFRSGN